MKNDLEKRLRLWPRSFITDKELSFLIKGTANSRYSKVKRLLKQGKLLHIRRGLYCLTEELSAQHKPHPFELAQFIYESSYISFEAALAYHGLIPERVYTVTSASIKRSKEFKTPVGVFSYVHLPLANFYTEVELVSEDGYRFFVAKAWKAICDYVYVHKKNWISLRPLMGSLRINFENLPMLCDKEKELLTEYYKNRRITRFLKGVQKDLILKTMRSENEVIE